MPTTWLPRHSFRKRQHWLLTNGEIVEEPDLEESSTGLKVRPIGSKESFFSRDVDTVIKTEVAKAATKRKAKVWMPLDYDEQVFRSQVGMLPPAATFAIPKKGKDPAAIAWWEFKHPTLPLMAHLQVTLKRTFGSTTTLDHIARMVYSDTRLNDGWDPHYFVDQRGRFDAVYNALPSFDDERFRNWSQEGVLEPMNQVLRQVSERAGVESLHTVLQMMSEIDEILIPDLREGGREPAWFTLELHNTNVNGEFLADVRDYVDSDEGALESVRLAYANLVDALRAMGVVIPNSLSENAFHQALIQGSSRALTVTLGKPLKDDLTPDARHNVGLNLISGTFVVDCTVPATERDAIAQSWDEAVFRAEMTGKEDELLAYARAYAQDRLARRGKTIARTRNNQLNPNH